MLAYLVGAGMLAYIGWNAYEDWITTSNPQAQSTTTPISQTTATQNVQPQPQQSTSTTVPSTISPPVPQATITQSGVPVSTGVPIGAGQAGLATGANVSGAGSTAGTSSGAGTGAITAQVIYPGSVQPVSPPADSVTLPNGTVIPTTTLQQARVLYLAGNLTQSGTMHIGGPMGPDVLTYAYMGYSIPANLLV